MYAHLMLPASARVIELEQAVNPTVGRSDNRRAGPLTVMRRHPLTSFFALAAALSWTVSLPYLLSAWGVPVPASLVGLVIAKQWIGPALAAMVMALTLGGWQGVRELRAAGRKWRVPWPWYPTILVGAPLLLLLGIVALVGIPDSSGPSPQPNWGAYAGYFVLVFIGVGLPEELGWRGFALPRLQARFGPLTGSVVLGVLWAAWHLAFFLTPDHGGGPHADPVGVVLTFLVFTVMVTAMSIVFTYLYNRSGGSVFAAALLHAAIDTAQLTWVPLLLPVGLENTATGERTLDLAALLAFGLLATALLALTRGRLGHQHPTEARE
jgi:membrane protease YdiL (CAAX protease family)